MSFEIIKDSILEFLSSTFTIRIFTHDYEKEIIIRGLDLDGMYYTQKYFVEKNDDETIYLSNYLKEIIKIIIEIQNARNVSKQQKRLQQD